jgi:hypothetical protein
MNTELTEGQAIVEGTAPTASTPSASTTATAAPAAPLEEQKAKSTSADDHTLEAIVDLANRIEATLRKRG